MAIGYEAAKYDLIMISDSGIKSKLSLNLHGNHTVGGVSVIFSA